MGRLSPPVSFYRVYTFFPRRSGTFLLFGEAPPGQCLSRSTGWGVSPAVVLTVRRFSGEQRARCSASLIKSQFHYECRVSAALNYVLPRHRSELIILSAPTRDEMSSGIVMGQGKQAKVLRRRELQRLLDHVSHTRHPARDRVMVLL